LEFLDSQIFACDKEIEKLLLAMDKQIPDNSQGQITFPFYPASSLKPKRGSDNNSPSFDARNIFCEITGVDLVAIDGLGENTVQVILSEVGLDMSKWHSVKNFVSWLGLAPNPKISGGKNLGNQKRKVKNRAAQAFRMAASSLHSSKCALGAFFRRIRARNGFKMAVAATARKLAVIFYFMLKDRIQYKPMDESQYLQKFNKQILKKIQRQAQSMGYQLVPKQQA
jgi:hypothetical protein